MIDRDDGHWTSENYTQRMLVKDWREILLKHNDTVVFHGCVRRLKARSIGAGVVEVYKVERAE
jgi:hypothetical protein